MTGGPKRAFNLAPGRTGRGQAGRGRRIREQVAEMSRAQHLNQISCLRRRRRLGADRFAICVPRAADYLTKTNERRWRRTIQLGGGQVGGGRRYFGEISFSGRFRPR